jgi:hypothetical protein
MSAGAVVAVLLDVPGLSALPVHHERERDRENPDDQEDPTERHVVDEADVELNDLQGQDEAEYEEYDAQTDAHVLSFLNGSSAAFAPRTGHGARDSSYEYPSVPVLNHSGPQW